MKKIISVLFLAIISQLIYAQSGALFIKNNTSCDLGVTMYAISPTCASNFCGDIVGNTFLIPSGNFYSISTWTAFASSPGWATMTNPVPMACSDFQWVQIDFTWSSCPTFPVWMGCATPTGGSMGDGVVGCTSTVVSYFWSGGGAGCLTLTGSWSPQSGSGLTDVAIDFH